jgi:hypothetical protein
MATIFLTPSESAEARILIEECAVDRDGHWHLVERRVRRDRKYPYISIRGRVIEAGKAAYDAFPEFRSIPAEEFDGVSAKQIYMHRTCGDPECINPQHLEPRLLSGISNGNLKGRYEVKFSEEDMKKIKEEYLSGITSVRELCKKYNVSTYTIYRIVRSNKI